MNRGGKPRRPSGSLKLVWTSRTQHNFSCWTSHLISLFDWYISIHFTDIITVTLVIYADSLTKNWIVNYDQLQCVLIVNGRQNNIKNSNQNRRTLLYWTISTFLSSTTLCKLLSSFTMPNLKKMNITIHFNGNLGHLCGVITH